MDEYSIYLRKSRADLEAEAHGEGETLLRHERQLLELAKRKEYNVTHIYREIVSGDTIAARPVVQELLHDVEEGLWRGVLVVEVERLARGDTIDQGIIAQTFKYSDTLIVTPSKVYDPNNEFDEEYFEFGLFMSRREYKTINRRLQNGRLAAAKEGKWPCGTVPYGYERIRIQNGKGYTLRLVEKEADIVRYIFRLAAYGEQSADGSVRPVGNFLIASRLTSLGVTPPSGSGNWNPRTIHHILKNPVYIGKVRYSATRTKKKRKDGKVVKSTEKSPAEDVIYVDGLHPACIDVDLFNLVQDRLSSSAASSTHVDRDLKNPFAGILVCGKCGYVMAQVPKYYNSKITYRYICRNTVCDNISCRADILENRVLQGLSEWLSGYKLEFSFAPSASDQSLIESTKRLMASTRKEIDTLRSQVSNTYDLLEQGVYDTNTFLERNRALAARISEAESKLKSFEVQLSDVQGRVEYQQSIVPKVENLLDVYVSLPDAQAKNEMLKGVLEKIEYIKDTRKGDHNDKDTFEITLYPKLPASD